MNPRALSQAHREHLAASGLSDAIISARGYWSSTKKAEQGRLGFAKSQQSDSALMLPLYDASGGQSVTQMRPDVPRIVDGKSRKYEWPAKVASVIDVHPYAATWIKDPIVPLLITEGTKKADAAVGRNMLAVALPGVWNWRGANEHGGLAALPDWDCIPLNGREVFLAFDSDAVSKRSVAQALVRLKTLLELRKAEVRVVYLPDGPGGVKVGLDDFLVAHPQAGLGDLRALASSEVRLPVRAKGTEGPAEIQVGLDIAPVADAVEAALGESHAVFQRGGSLVQVVPTEPEVGRKLKRDPAARIVRLLEAPRLTELAGSQCRFVDAVGERVGVPGSLARTLLARGHWTHFPVVTGVATAPALRPDGSVIDQAGYDRATGVFAAFTPDAYEPVPDRPGLADARAAYAQLLDPLSDFTFPSSLASVYRACAVGVVLTIAARNCIEGSVPLFAIGANTPGVGKGLLANALTMMATGMLPASMAPSDDSEETRKVLLSLGLASDAVVLIDNVVGSYGCGALASAITAREVRGRILGASEMVTVSFRPTILATGNNVRWKGDLGRRVVPIELEATIEQPENRTGFRYEHLLEHIAKHRARFVRASLTILRAFVLAGMPQRTGLPRFGSFEEWDQWVRHCLLWVAGVDVLDGRKELRSQADEDVASIGALLVALELSMPSGGRTAEILAKAVGGFGHDEELAAGLAGVVPSGHLNARTVGSALASIRGRVVDGRRLVARDAGGHRKFWRVERVGCQGESSESSESDSLSRSFGEEPHQDAHRRFHEAEPTHPTHLTHPQGPEDDLAEAEAVRHEANGGFS